MADNNNGQIVLGLDIPKTVSQINADIKKLEKQLEQVKATGALDTSATVTQINSQIAKLQAQLKTIDIKANVDTKNVQKTGEQIGNNIAQGVSKGVDKATKQLNRIQHLRDTGKFTSQISDVTADYNRLSSVTKELQTDFKTLNDLGKILNTSADADELRQSYEQFNTTLQKVKNSISVMDNQGLMFADQKKIDSLADSVLKFRDNNTKMSKDLRRQFTGIYDSLINDTNLTEKQVEKLSQQFSNLKLKVRDAGQLGQSFGDKMKNAFKKFSEWGFASNIVMRLWTELKNGTQFIVELDDALTDVTYTSNVSTKQLEELGDSAINMAKDLNTSAENILEAVKIYSTANATAEDILRKSQPAIMLSNVSGMSGSESSKTINTALNQFEIEDTEENLLDIVDTLEYVSSQLNYDFTEGIKEITEGIEASGNVAKNAGLNMQEYATMVGVAIEKTGQSGSTIGNAYKTIFSRITKASSTEGTLEEVISAAEESLRSVGVQVRDSANEFRDLTDIMADLGKVWNTLSSVEKSNIGYNVAGTRQLNILNSLMGSWESYSSIIEDIDERVGMSYETQEDYADSLQGHLGDLEATAQSVWNNILESKTLKEGIDLLTGLLSLVDEFTSSFGTLGTIGLGGSIFAGIKVFQNVDYLKMPVCPHHI